jgi:hypothetical protein
MITTRTASRIQQPQPLLLSRSCKIQLTLSNNNAIPTYNVFGQTSWADNKVVLLNDVNLKFCKQRGGAFFLDMAEI